MPDDKKREVELLINTDFGGFRLSDMAKIWLLALGYDMHQVGRMADGECPRDLPDLIEAFKRYGGGSCSSLTVRSLPEGTPYIIDEYDGAESIVANPTFDVAGSGASCKDFIPANGRREFIDMSRLPDEVVEGMPHSAKLVWLRTMHPLAYSRLSTMYEKSDFDEASHLYMHHGIKAWALETDEGMGALDIIAREASKEDYA